LLLLFINHNQLNKQYYTNLHISLPLSNAYCRIMVGSKPKRATSASNVIFLSGNLSRFSGMAVGHPITFKHLFPRAFQPVGEYLIKGFGYRYGDAALPVDLLHQCRTAGCSLTSRMLTPTATSARSIITKIMVMI
jgi:hypothetical protein